LTINVFRNEASAVVQRVSDEDLGRVKAFFRRDDIIRQLTSMASFLVPDGGHINVSLTDGPDGGSHISFSGGVYHIRITLPWMFWSMDEKAIFAALKALLGHESQHRNSSRFDVLQDFAKRVGDELGGPQFATIGQHMLNCTEDGRIERILCMRYPGYVNPIKFLNGTFYLHQPTEGNDELADLFQGLVMLSTDGVLPLEYDRFYPDGTPVRDAIEKARPLIIKAITSITSKECADVTWQIFEEWKPLIEELLKKYPPMPQSGDPEYNTSEENQNGEGGSGMPSHFVPSAGDDKEGQGEDGNGQEGDSKDGKDGKDGQNQKAKSNQNGQPRQSRGNRQFSPQDIEEQTNSAKEKAAADAEKQMKQGKEVSPKGDLIDTNLSRTEIADINKKYGNDYKFPVQDFKDSVLPGLPVEVQGPARHFRTNMEKLLKNTAVRDLRGQQKGLLDGNQLSGFVAMKNTNIFTQKGIPSQRNYVVYALKDGSGSMHEGDKEARANEALAIIEEGLKKLIPLKISIFGAHHGPTSWTVKEFNERESGSYTYRAAHRRGPGGTNMDGYNIRVAIHELMKRPERDRILIVLSDGLPSHYDSDREAIGDVADAVRMARKLGIYVVSVMFGSDDFREMEMDSYRAMYGDSVISCAPAEIPTQIVKLMQRLLSRR
jgi:hypothetical protein